MYHYKTCGLPNVWLENGFTLHETPYGPGVSIDDAKGLHKLLAHQVAMRQGRLTPAEVRFLRTHLGLSQRALATMLGCEEQTVSLWERRTRIPHATEAILRMLVLQAVDGNPKVDELLNRINTVDRLVNQRIVAKETHRRWKASVEVAPHVDEACELA